MKNFKLKKIYDKLYIFSNEIKNNHLDVYSAGSAFYLFISVIPFFILLFLLMPYTPITEQEVHELSEILPKDFSFFAQILIAEVYARNSAKLWIALFLAVWSAARGIMYITKGLNEIYDVTERRNYFTLRFWAAIYTMFIVIAIVILLTMSVFGKRIHNLVKAHLPMFSENTASWLATLLDFRVLIVLVFLFVLFVFFYTVLPNKKVLWVYQTPGAAICSVSWWLFSRLFSLIVGCFGGFSMYGSMATIIASMIWLYCCMYILFICAEINNHFANSIINYIKERKAARVGRKG